MRKRIAKQEALWYEEELQKEINEDRKAHGKSLKKTKMIITRLRLLPVAGTPLLKRD